ncbi:MAG: DUF1697 domain-containing protein [Hyphomicrobium sp.]|nr:DUF1697 domain-containing protein [Hyphomicrobium sp.]
MPTYIALLRAVNVGGTGKLAMAELKAICKAAGFADVQTYIASGNVVFESMLTATQVKAALEQWLHAYAGKPVGVIVRSHAEMTAVLNASPFAKSAPSRTAAIFLDKPPPADALEHVAGRKNEDIRLGSREIYVHYPEGIGMSKLRIPAATSGTARNMNTVAKLVEIAAKR